MTMLSRFSGVLGPMAAALILEAAASAAGAAPHPADPVAVAVGDLDLSSPRDAELFRRRVDKAAHGLCGPGRQLDFLETSACYRAVRAQCLRKLSEGQRRALLATTGTLWRSE